MSEMETSDRFVVNLPLDIVKAEESDNPDDAEWRIGGYASTSDEDRQGDEIVQKGLDYQDFVDYGFFNYDHRSDIILGYPDKSKCKVDSNGFYVEGVLLKASEIARNLYQTAKALKESGAPRKLGFSVEGKVLKRNSLGKIIKAKIFNVAITANPVNPYATWDVLVKSFTDNQAEIDSYAKSLDAGHGDANGSVLVPESLESAFKVLSYAVGDDDESKRHMEALKKKLNEKNEITKGELVFYLQLSKGLSREESLALADRIIELDKPKEV